MKRCVSLCLLFLPVSLSGCSRSPEVAAQATAAPGPAAVATATPPGRFIIASLPTPTPIPTPDPKATKAPIVKATPTVAPVAAPVAAPRAFQSVTDTVADAFDRVDGATSLDQIAAVRGDLASASLELDQQVRDARNGNDGSRAAITARAGSAMDMAYNAASAKYNYLAGSGDTITLNHTLGQRDTALRIAGEADTMIADPTFFERQNREASRQMGEMLNNDANRLRAR